MKLIRRVTNTEHQTIVLFTGDDQLNNYKVVDIIRTSGSVFNDRRQAELYFVKRVGDTL